MTNKYFLFRVAIQVQNTPKLTDEFDLVMPDHMRDHYRKTLAVRINKFMLAEDVDKWSLSKYKTWLEAFHEIHQKNTHTIANSAFDKHN